MVSQKEHIQTLIAEIDNVLQRTSPRLPWVMSGEVAQQRQVLERVRNYLVALQQSLPIGEGLGQTAIGTNPFSQELYPGAQSAPMGGIPTDMTPYQMMQSILQEVSYLRANLTPSTLNPPSVNQPQITAELLQVLMSRLQENLTQQIAQTLDNLRNQPPAYGSQPMLSGGLPPVPIPPQYDQLQALRSRSDQTLVNLDSTLNVVFESLQRNIQAYQEALSQGLERMYNTGQQSEYTFKLLLDQLVQQLKERVKQEASSYLLSSQSVVSSTPLQEPETQNRSEVTQSFAATGTPSTPISLQPASAASASPPPSPSFPYAGAELSSDISGIDLTTPAPLQDVFAKTDAPSSTSLDSAIESWLQSVSLMNQDEESRSEDPGNALPPLDLSDLDLSSIDLDEPSTDLNVASAAIAQPAPKASESPRPISPWPGTASTLSTTPSAEAPAPDIASFSLEQPTEASVLELSDESDEDTADIDAALKLLEDLSAELESSANSLSLEDAEAQLEQMLESTLVDEEEQPLAPLPPDAQDELDEFYQSLFGSESEQQAVSLEDPKELNVSSAVAADLLTELDSVAAHSSPDIELETISELETVSSEPVPTPLVIDFPSPEIDPLNALSAIGQPDEDQTVPLLLDLPVDLFAEPFEPISPENPVESELLGSDLFEEGTDLVTESIILPEPEPTATDLFGDEASLATNEIVFPEPEPTATNLFEDGLEPATDTNDPATSGIRAADLFDDVGFAANLNEVSASEPVALESTALEPDEIGTLTDLFQDVPTQAARSVPIDPPVIRELPITSPTPLVADSQGLFLADDLFGSDSPQKTSADQFTRAAPDEILLPDAARNEGSISLELDDLTLSSLSEDLFNLEGSAAARGKAPNFTLDDFAADVVAPGADVTSPRPEPNTIAPSAPEPFYQASSEIGNLSIDGFSDLFGDAPPTAPSLPPVTLPVNEQLPFTLEGANTLFEDFAPPPTPAAPAQPNLNEASPFTLDGMDDLFGDAPVIIKRDEVDGPNLALSMPPSDQSSTSTGHPAPVDEPFTLEGMDDLFGSLPSTPETRNTQPKSANSQPITPPREIPPFKPELYNPGDVMEPTPNFKLEQLDNLFSESPSSTSETNSSTPTESTIAAASSPTVADKQSLDAAFESLLGTPPLSSHSVETPAQPVPQKKKTP